MKRLLIILITALPLLLQAQTGREIAKKMDVVARPSDMSSNSNLVLTNSRGKTQEKTVRSLSTDDNRKQIIWFLAPARDKGTAFLKLEHDNADDEMILWIPAFKKLRRIKSSQKSESFMGSDMSYEDMTSRELDDYSYEMLGTEDFEGKACYLLESVPNASLESSYSRIVSWVDRESYLPLKEEFYNTAGDLQKRKAVTYSKIGSYSLPVEIYMEDLLNKSNTRLRIEGIEVDKGLSDDIFQEKNLSRSPM